MGELRDAADEGGTYYRWVKCDPCAGTGFPPRVYRAVGYRACPHCAGVGHVEFRRGRGDLFERVAVDLPEITPPAPTVASRRLDLFLCRVLPFLFILAFIAWAIIRRST